MEKPKKKLIFIEVIGQNESIMKVSLADESTYFKELNQLNINISVGRIPKSIVCETL